MFRICKLRNDEKWCYPEYSQSYALTFYFFSFYGTMESY